MIKVRNYLELFSRKNVLCSPSDMDSAVIHKHKWTIFCDGAWSRNLERGGFAAIALKDDVVYACRVGWLRNCESPREAEIRGVLAGVEVAQKLCSTEVEIVSDSVDAVWAFHSGLGGKVQDINLLQEGFNISSHKPGWCIRYIFGEMNQLADGLAKAAKNYQLEWKRADAVPIRVADLRFNVNGSP